MTKNIAARKQKVRNLRFHHRIIFIKNLLPFIIGFILIISFLGDGVLNIVLSFFLSFFLVYTLIYLVISFFTKYCLNIFFSKNNFELTIVQSFTKKKFLIEKNQFQLEIVELKNSAGSLFGLALKIHSFNNTFYFDYSNWSYKQMIEIVDFLIENYDLTLGKDEEYSYKQLQFYANSGESIISND